MDGWLVGWLVSQLVSETDPIRRCYEVTFCYQTVSWNRAKDNLKHQTLGCISAKWNFSDSWDRAGAQVRASQTGSVSNSAVGASLSSQAHPDLISQ